MKIRTHILFLLAPIILWIIWGTLNSFGQSQVDQSMTDPHGLIWKTDSTEIKSTVDYRREGELERFTLILWDHTEKNIYQKELTIDWDMSGGGFLKAMQADTDPEIEIVFINRGTGQRFYLDITEDRGIEKKFIHTLPETKALSKKWLKYHAPNPFTLGAFFMLTILYYILYFPLYWITLWLAKKKRSKKL